MDRENTIRKKAPMQTAHNESENCKRKKRSWKSENMTKQGMKEFVLNELNNYKTRPSSIEVKMIAEKYMHTIAFKAYTHKSVKARLWKKWITTCLNIVRYWVQQRYEILLRKKALNPVETAHVATGSNIETAVDETGVNIEAVVNEPGADVAAAVDETDANIEADVDETGAMVEAETVNVEVIEDVNPSDILWGLVEKRISTDCIVQINHRSLPKPKLIELHKMILFEFSPKFRLMCETDVIIKIEEVEPRIMEIALKHMYACKLANLNSSDVRELLLVAVKYDIKSLKEACAGYALKICTCENALYFLNLKSLITQSKVGQDLEIKLLKLLGNDTDKCITGKDKLNISEGTLIKLLQLNKLNLTSKLDLIKFVHRWAIDKIKREEKVEIVENHKLRTVLEPNIFPLMRFHTLQQIEFYEFLNICNRFNTTKGIL